MATLVLDRAPVSVQPQLSETFEIPFAFLQEAPTAPRVSELPATADAISIDALVSLYHRTLQNSTLTNKRGLLASDIVSGNTTINIPSAATDVAHEKVEFSILRKGEEAKSFNAKVKLSKPQHVGDTPVRLPHTVKMVSYKDTEAKKRSLWQVLRGVPKPKPVAPHAEQVATPMNETEAAEFKSCLFSTVLMLQLCEYKSAN